MKIALYVGNLKYECQRPVEKGIVRERVYDLVEEALWPLLEVVKYRDEAAVVELVAVILTLDPEPPPHFPIVLATPCNV